MERSKMPTVETTRGYVKVIYSESVEFPVLKGLIKKYREKGVGDKSEYWCTCPEYADYYSDGYSDVRWDDTCW